MADFRVVAIVSAFNEADIISPVIGHLVANGVDVYLIDNRSTDGTADAARPWLGKGLIGIEDFPKQAPRRKGPVPFDWGAILKRKEQLTREIKADWFIHHDADEFREPPWPGMKLSDAIRWVDGIGYNCIDFRVLNFPPLGNGFQPGADPGRHFTHWEDPVIYDTLQRKAWKAQKTPVSLAASGGHEARFPERRVFPIRFLLRHYPIRSQEHGQRKVFDERKNRFVEKERAKGWHVQYDSIADESHSFLGDPSQLHPYDPDRVRLDLMLENEPTREAEGKARELTSAAEAARLELAGALAGKHEAEKHAANLEKDREKLTAHLVERERHAANLETLKAEAERHSAGLEKDRDSVSERLADRERHTANLENTVGHLQQHAAGLERDRETIAKHVQHLEAGREHLEKIRVERERQAANLETTVAQLERHAAGLEKDRETLAKHIAHLEEVRESGELRLREIENTRVDGERHTANLETTVAQLERHAAGLEKDRQALANYIAERERELSALGTLRAERERHIGHLESVRAELERHVSLLGSELEAARGRLDDLTRERERLEQEMVSLRKSISWRVTAPARRLADLLKRLFR